MEAVVCHMWRKVQLLPFALPSIAKGECTRMEPDRKQALCEGNHMWRKVKVLPLAFPSSTVMSKVPGPGRMRSPRSHFGNRPSTRSWIGSVTSSCKDQMVNLTMQMATSL